MSFTFFLEETAWPYAHSLVPAALYIAARNPLIALLLIYFNETAEVLLAPFAPALRETSDDSLVGDIILGGMAIFIYWLIDLATGAHIAFRARVPLVLRITAAVLVILASFVVVRLKTDTINGGVLVFYAFYALIPLVLYSRAFFWPRRGTLDWITSQTLIAWLAFSFIYTIVALPVTDGRAGVGGTMWMRMFYTSFILLTLAFVVYAASRINAAYST